MLWILNLYFPVCSVSDSFKNINFVQSLENSAWDQIRGLEY